MDCNPSIFLAGATGLEPAASGLTDYGSSRISIYQIRELQFFQ